MTKFYSGVWHSVSYPSGVTDTAGRTSDGHSRWCDTGVRWRWCWRQHGWLYKHLSRLNIDRHARCRMPLRALLGNCWERYFGYRWLYTQRGMVSSPSSHLHPRMPRRCLLWHHLRRRHWQLIAIVKRPDLQSYRRTNHGDTTLV